MTKKNMVDMGKLVAEMEWNIKDVYEQLVSTKCSYWTPRYFEQFVGCINAYKHIGLLSVDDCNDWCDKALSVLAINRNA